MEITISKKRLVILLTIMIIFFLTSTVIAIYLLLSIDIKTIFDDITNFIQSIIVFILFIIFSIGILLFGIGIGLGIKKFFDTSLGLIVNQVGIFNNSTLLSGHIIKWDNILEFEIINVQYTKILYVIVQHPEELFTDVNTITKIFMKLNMRFYGSPTGIVSDILNCNFQDVVLYLDDFIKKNENTMRIPNH